VKEEEVINIANIQSRLGNSFRITGISNPNEARQLSAAACRCADCADSDC
jgi:preprotein translocase subunit SecD